MTTSSRATWLLGLLHWLSWAFVATGGAILIAISPLGLGAGWLLGGVLLVWTGIVKLVVLRLWTKLVGLGTDRHDPISPS